VLPTRNHNEKLYTNQEGGKRPNVLANTLVERRSPKSGRQ
jgi:hypothetical protein